MSLTSTFINRYNLLGYSPTNNYTNINELTQDTQALLNNVDPVIDIEESVITGAVYEDAEAPNESLTATGTIIANDDGDTLTWSIKDDMTTGTYGTISIDPSTGEWTYTLDNESPLVQGLVSGQAVTDTFTAIVTDDDDASTEQTITVTVNGKDELLSFESGNFTNEKFFDWETLGLAYVTDGPFLDKINVLEGATEGTYFARLASAGATSSEIADFLGVTTTQIDDITNGTTLNGSAIKLDEQIYLYQGQTITFDWRFSSAELSIANRDDISLFTTLNNNVQKLADVSDFGNFSSSGWESSGAITAPSDGYYYFGFAVLNENGTGFANIGENLPNSFLDIDNVRITGQIPD